MSWDQLACMIEREVKEGDTRMLNFAITQFGENQESPITKITKEPDEQRYKRAIIKATKKLFGQNPSEDDLLAIVCCAPTLKNQAWQKLKPQMLTKDMIKSGALKQIIKSKAPLLIRKEAAEILVKAESKLLKIWRKSTRDLKGIPKGPKEKKDYFECLKIVQRIKEDLLLVLESKLPKPIKKATAQELLQEARFHETRELLLIKKHVPSLRNQAEKIFQETVNQRTTPK